MASASFATALAVQFPDRADWRCVLRFYAALHLMNAYLIDKSNAYLIDKSNVNLYPLNVIHDDRRQAMKQCPELRDTPKRFRELKDLNERVRYDASFIFSETHRQLTVDLLARLAAIVEPKLRRS
ncbi:MAG: hypothetical protein EXS16_21950 [Gemmataceae bacterium]|nr:hypothetical protein [Gemmataceae bacterium]